MKKYLGWSLLGLAIMAPAQAEQSLFIAYPPDRHETTASQIFLIGTAPPSGEVQVNGQRINRNAAGHFAPSFPLQVGSNRFTVRHGDRTLQLTVIRKAAGPVLPTGLNFGEQSLTPATDIARLPGELVCLGAIAPANATVTAKLGSQTLALLPQPLIDLPANSAILTQREQPQAVANAGQYQGCWTAQAPGKLGQPEFRLTTPQGTIAQKAPGQVTILSPTQLEVIEVTAEAGVARTGPSTDYSRLTPLPRGTRASVTGREGEWLRLDYGGWIKRSETRTIANAVPPRTLIRSVRARQVNGWTEVIFPLQTPIPVTIQQGTRTLTLTLHNTTAQTDTIRTDDDPVIARLDWQQASPNQVQYQFQLKSDRQWGYQLRYEGTSLILSLRHPPKLESTQTPGRSLTGVTILLDPGHGSQNDLGARGPTGYPEKDVALRVSQLLRDELVRRGATVHLTRSGDEDLLPGDRVAIINRLQPTIALSLHYNALPDDGDALKTQGIAAFWYNPQAHSLAVFLHNYLTRQLQRPSYGVFWNNLALTRPTIAPAVMLELGFMINPDEFEWIVNPQAQQKLVMTLADGLEQWITRPNPEGTSPRN